MPNIAKIIPFLETADLYLGPATVLELDESGETAHIRIPNLPGKPEVWSRIALSFRANLGTGDEVLVAGDDINVLYIIGVLAQSNARVMPSPQVPPKIGTTDGAYAVIDKGHAVPTSEVLRVFSNQQELLFEYVSTAKKAKVFVQSGNLEFVTRDGDITLNSARDIQLKGQNIEMAGRSGIRIGIADIMWRFGSAILMGPRRMKFRSPEVNITSQRSRVLVDEMRYAGKSFLGKVCHLRIFAHVAEKTFKTVFEKAENIYTTVKRLSQLKAGRKRTIVDFTYHLKAKRSILKAEDDFKVNADKIHLG